MDSEERINKSKSEMKSFETVFNSFWWLNPFQKCNRMVTPSMKMETPLLQRLPTGKLVNDEEEQKVCFLVVSYIRVSYPLTFSSTSRSERPHLH